MWLVSGSGRLDTEKKEATRLPIVPGGARPSELVCLMACEAST